METRVKAPAKVNLMLRVTGKREDGYHEIKSVFQKIDLCDTLTFADAPDGRIELECGNPQVPVDESNLIVMAVKLLQKATGVTKGVKITLTKNNPDKKNPSVGGTGRRKLRCGCDVKRT